MALLEHLARGRDDARTDQGVVARGVVAQPGDRLGAGGLLGLERSGDERRQAEKESKRFHEGLPGAAGEAVGEELEGGSAVGAKENARRAPYVGMRAGLGPVWRMDGRRSTEIGVSVTPRAVPR